MIVVLALSRCWRWLIDSNIMMIVLRNDNRSSHSVVESKPRLTQREESYSVYSTFLTALFKTQRAPESNYHTHAGTLSSLRVPHPSLVVGQRESGHPPNSPFIPESYHDGSYHNPAMAVRCTLRWPLFPFGYLLSPHSYSSSLLLLAYIYIFI